jgi:hypothetical protein
LFSFLAACGPRDPVVPVAMEPLPEPVRDNPTGLLPVPAKGLQLPTDRYELAPAEEDTSCWHVNLRNTEPIDVVRIETAHLGALHHFNIFASTLEKEDGWGRCPDNIELFVGARPMLDGSGADVDYRFPEKIAVRLEPNALLIYQIHALNAGSSPRAQQFVINLHTEEAEHTLADIYGFTHLGLELPPMQRSTFTKDCNVEQEMFFLTMTAHFHARGTEATGEIIRQGQAPISLYRTERWDNPDVLRFDPPVHADPGDVVRIACSYDNKDNHVVRYGPDANDEMCFVFGYYFPKVGLVPCF